MTYTTPFCPAPRRFCLLVVPLVVACGSGALDCQAAADAQIPVVSYLDEAPPGETPIRFAPEVFTYELHASPVFSPDGNSVYWSEMTEHDQVMVLERTDGIWSSPRTATFSLPAGTSEPMLSPDGETLFFLSSEPVDGDDGENVWRVRRVGAGWSEPEPLGQGVNSHPLHWTVSAANDGSLYFGRQGDEPGIYRSESRDGVYQDAAPVGSGVNSEAYETTPFVAPDEGYLLFSRVRDGGMADLFVSFPGPDGTWAEALSLGDVVNTVPNHELCPVVTPDGEFLFFLRNVNGDLKPHWVRSSVFLNLRPE